MGNPNAVFIYYTLDEDEIKGSKKVPGPGQYPDVRLEMNQNEKPKWTIGTSKRDNLVGNTKIPGPNKYQIPNLVFLR